MSVRIRIRIPSLTLLALASGLYAEEQAAKPAPAASEPKPDVVVTAERRPSDPRRASAVVEVVDAEDIRERGGVLNPQDRLRRLPGVNVVNANGGVDGGVTYLNLRGTPSAYTQVQVDGIPVAEASTIQGDRNPTRIQPAGVARTEVVKGTQSGLYGSRAIGGVVNFLGDRPTAGYDSSVRVGFGSFHTGEAEVRSTGPLGDTTGYALAVEGLSSRGFSATTDGYDGNPGQFEPDGVDRGSGRLRLEWHPAERWTLSTTLSGSTANTGLDATPDDAYSLQQDRMGRVAVGMAFDGGKDADAAIDAAYTDYYRFFRFAGSTDETYRSDEYYAAGHGSLVIGGGLRASAGVDLRRQAADIQGFGPIHDADSMAGLWGQLAWGARWVEATLTGREDLHSSFNAHTSGRAGLALMPVKQVTVRAAVANGYRAPSLYERYVNSPRYDFGSYFYQQLGNADLEPETTRQGEAGLDLRPIEGLTLSGTLFRTLFDRRIASTSVYNPVTNTDVGTYRNEQAAARSDGIESSATAERLGGLPLTVRGWYTLTRTEDAKGKPFLRQPRHSGGAEATVREQRGRWGFWQNLGIEAQSGYKVYGFPDPLPAEGRTLMTAAVGLDYDGRYELALRGENLLNDIASPGPSFPNPFTAAPMSFYLNGTVKL